MSEQPANYQQLMTIQADAYQRQAEKLQRDLDHWTLEAMTARQRASDAAAQNQVIAAQVNAWIAQCTAQVEAALAYIEAMRGLLHTRSQESARDRLKRVVTSDAGRPLLVELVAARALAEVVRTYLHRDAETLPISRADNDAIGRMVEALANYDTTKKAGTK